MRLRRHDEVCDFLKQLAREAGYLVSETDEPAVGKLNPEDADTRCDGIIHALKTPQRETWFDGEIVDTGAKRHEVKSVEEVLLGEEKGKFDKHGKRVTLADGGDFVPIVCSVYGSLAVQCRQTIKIITERMLGKSREGEAGDMSRMLHLNRARFQAAIWRATALCVVGRAGKKAEEERRKQRAAEEGGAELPWECVAADAKASGEGLL